MPACARRSSSSTPASTRSRAPSVTPCTRPATTRGAASAPIKRSRARRTSRSSSSRRRSSASRRRSSTRRRRRTPARPAGLVGFGRDPLTEPSVFYQNSGIKRSGSMTLAACQDPTLSPYDILCWDPSEVIGDPGEDVSTCNVDSGGPLFIDQNGVRVVAGLTKGALNQGPEACVPPVEAFDTNVYRHHAWIAQTAAQLGAIDLSVTQCGALSQVEEDIVAEPCLGLPWEPGEATRVCGFEGELSGTLLQQLHAFQVPASSEQPAGQPERDLARHQPGGREPLRAGRRSAHHERLRLRGRGDRQLCHLPVRLPAVRSLVRARGPRHRDRRLPDHGDGVRAASGYRRRRRGGSVRQLPVGSQRQPEGHGRRQLRRPLRRRLQQQRRRRVGPTSASSRPPT